MIHPSHSINLTLHHLQFDALMKLITRFVTRNIASSQKLRLRNFAPIESRSVTHLSTNHVCDALRIRSRCRSHIIVRDLAPEAFFFRFVGQIDSGSERFNNVVAVRVLLCSESPLISLDEVIASDLNGRDRVVLEWRRNSSVCAIFLD